MNKQELKEFLNNVIEKVEAAQVTIASGDSKHIDEDNLELLGDLANEAKLLSTAAYKLRDDVVGNVKFIFIMPAETKKRLRDLADSNNTDMATITRDALNNYFKDSESNQNE